MITRNSNRLQIFDSFEIDRNLPKYLKSEPVGLTGSIPVVGTGTNALWFSQTNSSTESWGNLSVPMNVNDPGWSGDGSSFSFKKKSFLGSFFKRKKVLKEERQKTMTILNFFSSLAQSLTDLKTLQDTGIHYETLISNAAKAGQTALVDRLKLRLESAKSEIQLVVMGLNKFLTEEQIVDFYNQTQKDQNLKLTWIKHFVKPIPSKILELKVKLDEQFVFDNYVILHYDSKNDATDLTKEEKIERIKRDNDPILFGLIKDSRRLYYVADWVDDYCNLTLDTVIETLQEKIGEINNETVKTYLDLGVRKDIRVKVPTKEYLDEAAISEKPSVLEDMKTLLTKSVRKAIKKKK